MSAGAHSSAVQRDPFLGLGVVLVCVLSAVAACGEDGGSTATDAADSVADIHSDTPSDTPAADSSAGDSLTTDTARGDTAGDTLSADTGADAAADADRVADRVFDAFGTLSTIAGLGTIQDGAVNGWLASYEGGMAVDAELSRPHIALGDAVGNVYIADKDAHAVRKVTPDGRIHTIAGTGLPGDDGDAAAPGVSSRLSQPNGIWLRNDGTLYILDLGNDKVRRLAPDGMLTTLFVIGGAGTGRGLWVADDESVAFVAAGNALKRWTPGGGVATLDSGYVSLGNLVMDTNGTLLVSDRLGHRVYRVNPDTGDRTAIAGNGTATGGGDGAAALATGLDEVRGVWPWPEGGYFVATHKGGQVWYVDPDGLIHLFVDGDANDTHAGDGQHYRTPGAKISEPRAVVLDAAGNMLITENDFGYIRRIERVK